MATRLLAILKKIFKKINNWTVYNWYVILKKHVIFQPPSGDKLNFPTSTIYYLYHNIVQLEESFVRYSFPVTLLKPSLNINAPHKAWKDPYYLQSLQNRPFMRKDTN